MNLDINSLVGESLNLANEFTTVGNQIDAITQQGMEIRNAQEKLAKDAAAAATVKATTEVNEVARQEAVRKAIAARMGTDATKAGWLIGKMADQINEADKGLAEASARIAAKDSVSFLSDPLAYITNQFTINEDIAQYNLYARQKNRAEDTARQVEALTQQSIQTNNALSSTATEAYLGAMKVLGAYQYNMNAHEAAAQGARWNMEGIIASTNATRDRLQVLYSANSAIMQQKQWNVEMERLRMAKADHVLRLEAAKEKSDEESLILKYITDGYFNRTGKQMDALSAKNALILYKAKQPDIVSFFESGLESSMAGKPVISLSPYKASDAVGNGKVTNMSPAMQQVGDQLVTWRRQFENPSVQNQYQFDPKDAKAKEAAFNNFVADQKRLASGNVATGSLFAPYPVAQVAKLSPAVAATPLWKKVLEPVASTGVDLSDPNVTFGIVTSAIREGKITYSEALDLSLVYSAGLDLNNQTRNFIAFGIAPVRTYNAAVSIPGTFGKTTVNLADSKALATALNKAEAVAAQYRMQRPDPRVTYQPIYNQ